MAAMPRQTALTDFLSPRPPPAPSKRPPSLPMELVVATLDYLSFEDLRRAAAVCRQFKAAAYQYAGLYIHRNIRISSHKRVACARALEKFRELTQHAIQCALRVSLKVYCHFSYGAIHEDYYDKIHPWITNVFICIKAALPVLVSLSIRIPQIFYEEMAVETYLCLPAPYLVELDLSIDHGESHSHHTHKLSGSMFADSAPKLAKVELRGIFPGDNPIPAFSSAREVLLAYGALASTPVISLASHFPSLRVLILDVDRDGDKPPTSQHLDLSGLSLRRLVINDDGDTGILSTLSAMATADTVFYNIPFIEHWSNSPIWCPSLWDSVKGNLHLRILSSDIDELDTHVTIVTEDNRLFRSFRFEGWAPYKYGGWNGLRFLSARFTYSRLNNEFAAGFIWSFIDGMPALRHVHIDFCEDSNAPSICHTTSRCARCPVLETITLFAMDKPTHISCRQLVMFGRALGQQERAPGNRPILTLVGVTLSMKGLDASLPLVFPTITYRAFEGRGTRGDRKAGIWEL